jgi:hypothetical protein
MKNDNTYNWQRKCGRMTNTFTINNYTYNVELSIHAESRLKERNIDLFQAVGVILALGEKRIKDYTNSKRDILIHAKENGISVVCSVESNTIVIRTVIDNADAYAKVGTSVVNL